MKTHKNFIIGSILFLSATAMQAQQVDMGQHFITRGFVADVDAAAKQMRVNFTDKTSISSEKLRIGKAEVTNSKKETLEIKDLRSGYEVMVEGERYVEKKYTVATKITIMENNDKNDAIKNGRIDYVNDGFAYIDGRRVTLGSGKSITGKKNKGYDNKNFTRIDSLKLGDIASVQGEYAKGSFVADAFVIEPETITAFDKSADTVDKVNYKKFYPAWNDKSKRAKFFNSDIPGIGKIYADPAVQEYVNALGQKLIPKHIQKKTKFIFIVIDNDDVNANVRANGLSYVYTGLLKSLENEAQLAAILGHEIAHAMYEHMSSEQEKNSSAKTGGFIGNFKNGIKKSTQHVVDKAKGKGKNTDKDKEKTKADTKAIHDGTDALYDTAGALLKKQSATFSITQEFQADRVGLSLMVLAGYDPREATEVWRSIYSRYGKEKAAGVSVADYGIAKLNEQEKTGDKDKTKQTDTEKAVEIATDVLNWKKQDYNAKSLETHPEAIKRFEALNQLIALYWSDPEALEKSTDGAEKYAVIKGKFKQKK